MKKLTLIAAVLLCLSLSLTACTSYRNDVAVTDLTSSVLEVVSTYDGFVAPVFILNAIDRSLKSGCEEKVNGLNA